MNATATPHEMPVHACLDRLRAESIGRICVVDRDFPLAFPMTYRVLGEHPDVRIVMRTAPETAIGRHHGNASLEVDHIDLAGGRAWSVIVRGTLRPLHGDVAPVDPEPLISTGRDRWMMLDVTAISGRTFEIDARPGHAEVDWRVVAPDSQKFPLPYMPPD